MAPEPSDGDVEQGELQAPPFACAFVSKEIHDSSSSLPAVKLAYQKHMHIQFHKLVEKRIVLIVSDTNYNEERT